MDVLRTPDERFASLPDYPFEPNYIDVAPGLRAHYVDEGPREGPVVLLLHGEPSWSYLYRKMVPLFVAAGMRAIAPDLIGFGRSDKPVRREEHTYARHVAWTRAMIEGLALKDLTLVGESPELFARVVVANGFLPTADRPTPRAFRVWRAFARYSPVFPIGRIVASGCVSELSPQVRAAYDAPFPSTKYTAGAREFPALVPTDPRDPAVPANRAAWESLARFDKPFLTLFGKNDPILGNADRALQRHVKGAEGQPHERTWGGHFVQEDRGPWLAERTIDWMKR